MGKEVGRRRARSEDDKEKRVRVTRKGNRDASEKRREAAGDGATSRSVEAFQFVDVGNA